MLIKSFIILISLICVLCAAPINNIPNFDQFLVFSSLSMDTLAFSSEDKNHNLMRIVYADISGHERHFDADKVFINENFMKLSFKFDNLMIDRRKIRHIYIIEID